MAHVALGGAPIDSDAESAYGRAVASELDAHLGIGILVACVVGIVFVRFFLFLWDIGFLWKVGFFWGVRGSNGVDRFGRS
ncbi:hypothetical protein GCM10009602_69290 [Nocardiopsis tropica]